MSTAPTSALLSAGGAVEIDAFAIDGSSVFSERELADLTGCGDRPRCGTNARDAGSWSPRATRSPARTSSADTSGHPIWRTPSRELGIALVGEYRRMAQLQWIRQLDESWGRARVLLRADLQLSEDELLPLERFAIGGRFSVRGYRENLGKSWTEDRANSLRTLASAGVGLRYSPRPWIFTEVYWGARLRRLDRTGNDIQNNGFHLRFEIETPVGPQRAHCTRSSHARAVHSMSAAGGDAAMIAQRIDCAPRSGLLTTWLDSCQSLALMEHACRPRRLPRAWTPILMIVMSAVGLTASACARAHPERSSADREVVVLLHGLGRTRASMMVLEHHLTRAGFDVRNLGYPSTEASIPELAQSVRRQLDAQIGRDTPVHFVTHSLGGIVVREMLATQRDRRIGRVVMLGPPSQGSLVAEKLRQSALWAWLSGPAGRELGVGPGTIPRALPAVDYETGVVAGRCSINPFASWLIPGPDDGAVAVARTHVAGMRDVYVLCQSHTLLMFDPRVAHATTRFLTTGSFDPLRDDTTAPPASR